MDIIHRLIGLILMVIIKHQTGKKNKPHNLTVRHFKTSSRWILITLGSGANLTRLHSAKQPAATSSICSSGRLAKPLGALLSLLASPSKALGTGTKTRGNPLI